MKQSVSDMVGANRKMSFSACEISSMKYKHKYQYRREERGGKSGGTGSGRKSGGAGINCRGVCPTIRSLYKYYKNYSACLFVAITSAFLFAANNSARIYRINSFLRICQFS